jgi:hypothetical protein
LVYKENPSQKIPVSLQEVLHDLIPMVKTRTGIEDVVRSVTSQILGVQGWWRRAEEREKWRRLLRETRFQKGL